MTGRRQLLALFGRVNCGKSSLLNSLLKSDVLPVGVNPITAVPTKVRYGREVKASVAFAGGRKRLVSIVDLAKLVTEQGIPGNLKNVVYALIELPSERLRKGIALVDTPGLGSLARRGGAETLAYLPSCDLALLLIDAGATITEENIGTLRLLYEAGVPALVMLSKADLLAKQDLDRAMHYIRENIERELSLRMTVHPVSALRGHSVVLDQFFEHELLPRFQMARALREAAVARKIGLLRESVTAAMETALRRGKPRPSTLRREHSELEGDLRITGQLGEQHTALDHAFRTMGESPEAIVEAVAQEAIKWISNKTADKMPSSQLSEWVHEAVAASVRPPIDRFHEVGVHAIQTLKRIAGEMERIDAPAEEDFALLLRNLPRFDLAVLPTEISVKGWKLWGKGVLRFRISQPADPTHRSPPQAGSSPLWTCIV